MTVPAHLKYTKEHEWLEIEDNIATIGITAFAQDSLGDVVFIEMPEVGREISSGEEFAVVESVKAASEVYSPVSGEIIEINEALTDAPEAVNNSPYDDGWMIKIKMSDKKELEETMDADAYTSLIEDQA